MWILLVEDEPRLAKSLKQGLEEEGFTVDVRTDGYEAELAGLENEYELAVVDWRLPGQDGRTVIEKWRKEGRHFPVLMLTVMDDVEHRVAGLDAGADDYLTKPFAFEELLARIRALLRRYHGLSPEASLVEHGPLRVDLRARRVWFQDKEIFLRPKEYALLELFVLHPNQVFSKTQLAERVWGDAYYVTDNLIEVTLSTLRQKLGESLQHLTPPVAANRLLETVRGAGYRFNPIL